jgi:hypothetical protein
MRSGAVMSTGWIQGQTSSTITVTPNKKYIPDGKKRVFLIALTIDGYKVSITAPMK